MCEICASGLLAELDKIRNRRPHRVIIWAKRRGLNITEQQLETHFSEHAPAMQPSYKTASPASPDIQRPEMKNQPEITALEKTEAANHSDNQFLDEVVRRVFDDLVNGKFELKIEHGFKAIEIRQKVEDKTDSERLLLELLNEIRTQELP